MPIKKIKRNYRKVKYVLYKETLIDKKEHFFTFLGAFFGIGIIGYINSKYFVLNDNLFLIGSFGASSVLIYGAINSPLAQPRNLIGGHLVCAMSQTLRVISNKRFVLSICGRTCCTHEKEELMLFPFIRKMVHAIEKNIAIENAHFGSVQNPIQMMMNEHNAEGENFRKINALSGNYNAPVDACNTYKVTFALLKEFETDLHLHIHLENNILFPKAVKLEKQLFS